MQTASKAYPGKLFLKKALLAGLLAGTLDAIAAIINYYAVTGKSPVIVFEYIASGVFGKQAYTDGAPYAIFGLLFHFLIAMIFAVFYFWIYPTTTFLQKNSLASAILYGIFIWLVMNLLIVPLFISHTWTFHVTKVLLAMFILIVCIGIPVSFLASSFYKKNRYGKAYDQTGI